MKTTKEQAFDMSDENPGYHDLEIENSWVEYVRARLPYHFMEISEERTQPRVLHFRLSDPVLRTGMQAPERHNFWERGNVYYMTGKLMDFYSMPKVSSGYRLAEVLQLITQTPSVKLGWPTDALTFYNSIQMEKVLGFMLPNHLDRERVMMTNVMMAIELCLKAVMTHANYHMNGNFTFGEGHDVDELFEHLPDSLQEEMVAESKVFAIEYPAFRNQVEAEIEEIRARFPGRKLEIPNEQQAKEEWERITDRVRESKYTAFVNSNDPGREIQEDWFEAALERIKEVKGTKSISLYFRYAPQKDRDELPTDLIAHVLLLGRFLYEHLFPVPPDANLLPHSQFPRRSCRPRVTAADTCPLPSPGHEFL